MSSDMLTILVFYIIGLQLLFLIESELLFNCTQGVENTCL